MKKRRKVASAHPPPTDFHLIGDSLENGDREFRYSGTALPLGWINILPQPRKTFEEIGALAENISRRRLMNPLIVAKFSRESCERYLSLVNLLWGTEIRSSSLRPSPENQDLFYILLAGERRFRALVSLWTDGCSSCRETHGKEREGECFSRHLGGNAVRVSIAENIPAFSALFIQFSENTHMAVPAHEEAHAYDNLYRIIRQAKPDYPLSRFARDVGRSPDTIKRALKFCELPLLIQDHVSCKKIPYGIAIELARLRDSGIDGAVFDWWVSRTLVEHKRVPEFRDMVSHFLEERKTSQCSLFGLPSEDEQRRLEREHVRRVVEATSIRALWAFIHYTERVMSLFERGELGQNDSPFSAQSPVRLFRRLLEKHRKLLPHLKSFLPKRDFEKASLVLSRGLSLTGTHAQTKEGKR